jgi:hypothetical protein
MWIIQPDFNLNLKLLMTIGTAANGKIGKYFLFFMIPAITVLVSAKQPTTHWEVLILLASMALQGFIALKALQSDPNATDQDKSNNMGGNGGGAPKKIEASADRPVLVSAAPEHEST